MKEKTAVNFTPQPRLQLHFRQGNLQGLPVALFVQNSVGQFSGNNLEMAGRENDGEQKRRECSSSLQSGGWVSRTSTPNALSINASPLHPERRQEKKSK
ncbi:hypothetical protein VTJ04DRAFT_3474 [Mycothermus thermophilus]|uniref:uncharacterized protein n=1 Tax=Humicola insolens TaxID=85995 RepID=UPI0037437D5A